MSRPRLGDEARDRGRALGAELAQARRRAGYSAEAVARAANISVDTVRSIESGRTATPEFFTVVAMAVALGLSLDGLYEAVATAAEIDSATD